MKKIWILLMTAALLLAGCGQGKSSPAAKKEPKAAESSDKPEQ